ncbi:MAG: hypothetical protein LQ337_003363 [Flavoplaca oasis]|nr:MAG: hypothetical protein LQ337_003363 [Flavoplaca oasis]
MGASSIRKESRKRKFGSPKPPSNLAPLNEHKSTSASPVDIRNPMETQLENPQPSEIKPHRFIVFVGNLPYSATNASIQEHFAKLRPTSVRHLHDKTSGKSKGYAFLEFKRYDRLKTCLRTFHQSKFDDGISPPRLLNVELTAGGGGSKSKDRRLKLKVKNDKLRQERERRAIELASSEGKSVVMPKPVQKKKDDVSKRSVNQDIHPSRRARVGVSK